MKIRGISLRRWLLDLALAAAWDALALIPTPRRRDERVEPQLIELTLHVNDANGNRLDTRTVLGRNAAYVSAPGVTDTYGFVTATAYLRRRPEPAWRSFLAGLAGAMAGN